MMLEELINVGKTTDLFKKLEKNKEDKSISLTLIEEIERRLSKKEYAFTNMDTNYIYTYFLVANKYEHTDYLEKLINDKSFLKVLDKTNIDGGILPSLTSNCSKPRKALLKESNLFRKSILNDNSIFDIEEILDDLTIEEIKILREDLRIDNLLISKGIRFDTLKDETEKIIVEDPHSLVVYDIYTLSQFANNTNYLKKLSSNQIFLKIYLDKMNNDYSLEHKLFKIITKKQVFEILSERNDEQIIFNILKNVPSPLKKELLEKKNIKKLVEKTNNEYILLSLPEKYIVEILKGRNNLFKSSNIKVLDKLSLDTLKKISNDNSVYKTELKKEINNGKDLDYSKFLQALTPTELNEIVEKELPNLNLKAITYLLKSSHKIFKPAILKNKELCTRITNELTIRTYYKLEDLFKYGKFTVDEKTELIKNSLDIVDNKVLTKMLESIPVTHRKTIYENDNIREKLLKDNTYTLDEHTIKHLSNNKEELIKSSPKVIVEMLNHLDIEFASSIFKNDKVLEKIFTDKNSETILSIIEILKNKKELLPIFKTKEVIKYYNKEYLHEILKLLTLEDRVEVCQKDIVNQILSNNNDYLSLYKKLSNNNRYLLNTLDFRIFEEYITKVKYSIVEDITKDIELQEYLVRINKHLPLKANFINNIFTLIDDISYLVLKECLLVIAESCEGINRKLTGNISKMLNILDLENITIEELKDIVSYILHIIPRHYKHDEKVTRLTKINAPNTFEDLKEYEAKLNEKLTSMMNKCNPKEVVRYFLEKHFKLSYDEATIMLNKYSIKRVDETVYKEEYNYLDALNKIYNTDSKSLIELDNNYQVYTMYESFKMEYLVKKMYGKIYNYELRNKNYYSKSYTKSIYGKELRIYECRTDFTFLVADIDFQEELAKTNSYFESYHNVVNKLDRGIKTNLISNDNLTLKNNVCLGYSGLREESILKISPYDVCSKCNSILKEKYMTPRELIDNTRDINNTIIIDKYAIRPNYNNSNIPNIEPDYLLVDGNNLDNKDYLELISRISEEFKTKRNKTGLPIIALSIPTIAESEATKINTVIKKYQKNHDMNLLNGIINKIGNNSSAYETLDTKEITIFDEITTNIENIIIERIKVSNSNSELTYIENIFEEELEKYKNTSKKQNCNFKTKEIKEHINNRKSIINK